MKSEQTSTAEKQQVTRRKALTLFGAAGVALIGVVKDSSAHQLPIVNLSGEYWIIKSNNIPISTDVSWGKSTFHLNEQFNSKTIARFNVLNDELPQNIIFDDAAKKRFLAQLKPGVMYSPN